MGAASVEAGTQEDKQAYVSRLLADLLCTERLPPAVELQVAQFDPACFDLGACAQDFERDPPMSKRRLLELAVYVTLADGQLEPEESRFIRDLGEALRMAPGEYADLIAEESELRSRESFIELARVPIPYRKG